ncbi:MAG: hypothetical protein EXS55_03915 [Candidatus Magasanikbacteria bacterium]|nr:hypothetical protein [Candidatus Magasanikbacteria bacterium]
MFDDDADAKLHMPPRNVRTWARRELVKILITDQLLLQSSDRARLLGAMVAELPAVSMMFGDLVTWMKKWLSDQIVTDNLRLHGGLLEEMSGKITFWFSPGAYTAADIYEHMTVDQFVTMIERKLGRR